MLLAVSGVLLFVPSADRYAASPIFFIKMGAIAAGGLNALAFHVAAWRRVDVWGSRARTPWTARTTAVVSILVWVAVIVLGRWMGYERRDPPGAELELPSFAAADEPDRATRAPMLRTRRARPGSP